MRSSVRLSSLGKDADDLALVHDHDAVGEFSSPLAGPPISAGWPGPRVALVDQFLVNELDGADVDAAGGLGGDEQLGR